MKSALAAIFIGYSGLAAVSVVGLCCLLGQDVFQFSRGQEFRCDIAAVRFPLVFCHTDNQPVPDVSVFTGLEHLTSWAGVGASGWFSTASA